MCLGTGEKRNKMLNQRTREEVFGRISYDPKNDKFTLETQLDAEAMVNEKIFDYPLSAPLTLHWLTTMKCNARCKYCYEKEYLLNPKADEDVMNPREIHNFIDNFSAVGGFRLYLTGGEPTLNPYLPEIIRYAYKRSIKCVVNSNGLSMPQGVYSAIKDCESRLSLSLDSHIKEVHNSTRSQGSYDSIINLIERAQKDNLDLRIISVLQDTNPQYWQEFGNFLGERGVKNWFIQGVTGQDDKNFNLEPLEKFLKSKFSQMRIRVLPAMYESFFYVMPNGDVGTNMWAANKKLYGNLREDPLEKIWSKTEYTRLKDYCGLLNIKFGGVKHD